MIYAITGHTQGIGKKIYERLSPNIIGFSKSTGYDINKKEDRFKIIEESKNCAVFINNATDKFGQTELFLELFKKWKDDETKTIINVGSRIAEIRFLPEDKIDLINYQAEKLILKEMSTRLKGKCKIKYRWFSYVGTEKILKKYPHFTKDDYISEDQAADIILL
jgi:hypothetical protein